MVVWVKIALSGPGTRFLELSKLQLGWRSSCETIIIQAMQIMPRVATSTGYGMGKGVAPSLVLARHKIFVRR